MEIVEGDISTPRRPNCGEKENAKADSGPEE
jgi:hypothetical protein